MKILFSIPTFQPLHEVESGRLTQQAYIQQGYIALGLREKGHQLTFFAPTVTGQIVCTHDTRTMSTVTGTWSNSLMFEIAAKGSWRLQRLFGVPYLNFFSNLRLYDACIRCLRGHDLVFERHGLYRTGVASACRRLKLPYVLFFDADPIYEQDYVGDPIRGILRKRAEQTTRYCLKIARHVICPSNVIKHQLCQRWGVSETKITVLPNAVDTRRHRPFPESRQEVRALLGIDEEAPVFVFVGTFYRWHDVDTLVKAFSKVIKTLPKSRLVLIGDGNRYEEVRRLVADLDLTERVVFVGRVSNDRIPHFIAAADVAVAPYPKSQDEFWGSPMKLFEYMACGIAIVASGVGQINDLITDGVNGVLVPPGDPEALATALQNLTEDVDFRRRLAYQARKDAVNRHSWEQYVDRVDEILRQAADTA